MKLSSITSKYRASLIVKAYREWLPKSGRLLDVGSGTGTVGKIISQSFNMKIVGCDTIKYTAPEIPIMLINNDGSIPFKKASFSAAMFNDVLHHTDYAIQEKLIRESLKVAKKVLIFELKPTLIGHIFDWLLNKIHNPAMKIPFAYRKPSEWINLFEKMKINYKIKQIDTPFWYPFSHVSFCLFLRKI